MTPRTLQSGLSKCSPAVLMAPWKSNKVSNAGGQCKGKSAANALTCKKLNVICTGRTKRKWVQKQNYTWDELHFHHLYNTSKPAAQPVLYLSYNFRLFRFSSIFNGHPNHCYSTNNQQQHRQSQQTIILTFQWTFGTSMSTLATEFIRARVAETWSRSVCREVNVGKK